jgi:hypothetical protein
MSLIDTTKRTVVSTVTFGSVANEIAVKKELTF